MEKKILFIDDDPDVLQGLRRTLRPFRKQWLMQFVDSAKLALSLMDVDFFDVVVTDLRMPGMDGIEFLEQVMEKHPQTIRIVLSGETDRTWMLKSAAVSHQFLNKPCRPDVLKKAILRASLLFGMIHDPAVKRVVSRMKSLPSLPTLYAEIMNIIQSKNASIKDVGEVIAKDMAMTAKILQMVNSAFFGFPTHISDPGHAAVLLGLNTVKSLVLSAQVFSQFDAKTVPESFLESLWQHNLETGGLAKEIALAEGMDRENADHAFMAGLLHDSGKLVLATNFPEKYTQVIEQVENDGLTYGDAEFKVFGISHAEVGAYLLGLWGLPLPIVEALAFHHCPDQSMEKGFSPLAAVHIANALASGFSGDGPEDASRPELDMEYLKTLQRSHRLSTWKGLVAEMKNERLAKAS